MRMAAALVTMRFGVLCIKSKSNGTIVFRKIRSKIVDYLQRYSSFSVLFPFRDDIAVKRVVNFPIFHHLPFRLPGNNSLVSVFVLS